MGLRTIALYNLPPFSEKPFSEFFYRPISTKLGLIWSDMEVRTSPVQLRGGMLLLHLQSAGSARHGQCCFAGFAG
jgi:hypothetical protein